MNAAPTQSHYHKRWEIHVFNKGPRWLNSEEIFCKMPIDLVHNEAMERNILFL